MTYREKPMAKHKPANSNIDPERIYRIFYVVGLLLVLTSSLLAIALAVMIYSGRVFPKGVYAMKAIKTGVFVFL